MTKQQWQEHAIDELKEYLSLPQEIQFNYTPVYSAHLLKFLYIKDVKEHRGSTYSLLMGDVLRTEDSRLFTIEDIKTKENIE